MREKRSVWFHSVASRIEIAPSQDVLGVQYLDNFVSADASCCFIDLENDVLEVISLALVERKHTNSYQLIKRRVIEPVISSIDLNKHLKTIETRQPHRRRNLAHLPVGPHGRYSIEP